jgi:hypothetical protein
MMIMPALLIPVMCPLDVNTLKSPATIMMFVPTNTAAEYEDVMEHL